MTILDSFYMYCMYRYKESGMSIQDLQALPQGRHRRSRHDDTTAVVIYF